MLPTLLIAATLSAPALAVEEDALEVVVTSNPYARWDGTRWRVDVQFGMPYPVPLYAEVNREVHVVGFDVAMVLACELGEFVHRRARDVACNVEDASLQAAPWLADPPGGSEVVLETAERLKGLKLRLQVTEEGAVTDLTLVDEPQSMRRVNVIYENLRQVVSRAVVGFHLQTPERFTLGREWRERNSRLFSVPAFRWLALGQGGLPDLSSNQGWNSGASGTSDAVNNASSTPALQTTVGVSVPSITPVVEPVSSRLTFGRNAFDVMQAPASLGFSLLVHRMDRYKGKYMVQTRGEGSVDIGDESPVTFKGAVAAVSVFEPQDGVMSERVWTLQMGPTAGSLLAEGPAGWPYWHQGRLAQLQPEEQPELGESGLVAWPGHGARGQLAPWPALR